MTEEMPLWRIYRPTKDAVPVVAKPSAGRIIDSPDAAERVGYVQFACGCRLEHRRGDAPVRAWECEHGNSIRAVDPPDPHMLLEYERHMRELQ